MSMSRDSLLKDLRANVIEVMFTKVDGTQRNMRCTLRADLLPSTFVAESDQETRFHKENKDVIACWDVQKGGWRSFRIDSVQYAQVLDAY